MFEGSGLMVGGRWMSMAGWTDRLQARFAGSFDVPRFEYLQPQAARKLNIM